MNKKINLTVLLSVFYVFANSQTVSENLDRLVELYDNIDEKLEFYEQFNEDTVILEALIDYTDAAKLFTEVINNGNEAQQNAAKFILIFISHDYGVLLSYSEKYNTAEVVFNSILKPMNSVASSYFPITYQYKGKEFKITLDNYKAIQAEFFYYYALSLYNNFKFEEAVTNYEKYIQLPLAQDELKITALYNILFSHQKKKFLSETKTGILNDEKLALYTYNYLNIYYSLNDEAKIRVNKNSLLKPLNVITYMMNFSNNDVSSASAMNYVGLITNLTAKHEKQSKEVLDLYEMCFKNLKTNADYGIIYAFDKSLPAFDFENSAQEYALSMRGIDKVKAESVGFKAIDQMTQITESKCEKLLVIAEAYAKWGDYNSEKGYRKQAENCSKEKLKLERKRAREDYLNNNNLNTYFGINVLPLLNSNEKRDYGGVVNFTKQKFALELSYLQINQNKENIFDLWIKEVDYASQDNVSRWDGFYAHIQPKFFDSDEQKYVGLLLGYAQKSFDPMEVNITNIESSNVSTGTFNPSEKQYIAMINIGGMKLSRGFGLDMYWGFGATYNQFDLGFNQDMNKFTIDNPLLENRKAPYFTFIMRFGINFGLNFGRGN